MLACQQYIASQLSTVNYQQSRASQLSTVLLIRSHEALAQSGTILPHDQPLPLLPLRGDWAAVAEQVVFKANVGDVKAASKIL